MLFVARGINICLGFSVCDLKKNATKIKFNNEDSGSEGHNVYFITVQTIS